MKNNIKRITALLVCAAMLTACGNNGGAPASAPAESTTAAATEAPAPETAVSETQAETEAEQPAGEGYRILIRDESGNPVKGVMVQFCSDSECILGETGTDGIAEFASPDGAYTIHILKAPDGFESEDNEYPAPAVGGTVEIVLKSAAADNEDDWQDIETVDYNKPLNIKLPEYGVSYREPDKFFNMKGFIDLGASSLSDTDPVFRSFYFYYTPFSRHDKDDIIAYFDAMIEALKYQEEIPEPADERWASWLDLSCILSAVYITDADFTEEQVCDFIAEYDLDAGEIAEIEKIPADINCTVWYVRFDGIEESAEEKKDQLGEYYDELIDIYHDKETQLSALTFNDPTELIAEPEKVVTVDDLVSFETTDLDGNTVSSSDLFADHKITMINIWATWCGPCKKELPDLSKLAKEFEEKGGQIIGLCDDADSDKHIERAKSILAENGCDYLNLCPFDNYEDVLPITAYPTTYFVDSEGRVLAEPIRGNYVDEYTAVFEECLKAME